MNAHRRTPLSWLLRIGVAAVLAVCLIAAAAFVRRGSTPSRLADEPVANGPVTHEGEPEVLAAARRFLNGFLPYTYGLGRASHIRDTTPEMLRQLAASPPRLRTIDPGLRPRVTDVSISRVKPGDLGYDLVVTVTDRDRTYRFGLAVAADDETQRWVVVGVQ